MGYPACSWEVRRMENSLLKDGEIRKALEKIVKYEEETEERYKKDPVFKGLDVHPYWDFQEVAVPWQIIRKLLFADVVKAVGGRRKQYFLVDRDSVKKSLQEYEGYEKIRTTELEVKKQIEIPSDIFDVIEEYGDLKDFIKLSLSAEEPVHGLLVGAPGTAKSLFLMELERLEGSHFITAGTATKVGIRDIIYEDLPRYLLIDEIEKISDSKDLSSLLTWMETGRIIITKHGLKDEKRGKGWVFGACNTTRGLPSELMDRFQVFHIKPYNPEQFRRVVIGYLTKRLKVEQGIAEYIADEVGKFTVSIRQAIRVSRIARTRGDVSKVLKIIRKYGCISNRR